MSAFGSSARRLAAATAVCILTALPAASLTAQGDGQAYAFVLRLANGDTVSVERVVRSATRLQLDLGVRMGASVRATMDLTLGAGATVTRLALEGRRGTAAPDSPPSQRVTVTLGADSATVEVTPPAGAPRVQRFATGAPAIPYVNPSFALVEQMVMRARALGGTGDTTRVPLFEMNSGQTVSVAVVRIGSDSVAVAIGPAVSRLAVDAAGHVRGGVIPGQGLVLERTSAIGADAMREAKPDYSAPAGAPYTAVDVVVPTTRGYTLAGTLTIPSGVRGPVPAIVTITGSGPEERDEAIPMVKGYRPFRQIADTLARRGIAVLRMDDRGFGGSGGNGMTATSADFAEDIESGLAYLRTRPEIDPRRLGLIGHSEGGMIAPMVAVRDTGVRAIVLMAGPSRIGRDILAYQIRNNARNDTSLTPARRDSMVAVQQRMADSAAAAQPWMRFFWTYDPVQTIKRVRVPVLILQGATDQQVTPDQAPELLAALRGAGNTRVTMRVFPNANHLFVNDPKGAPSEYERLPESSVRADVLGALADWTVQQLGPTRPR
jgi:uncharacterized protein